MGWQIIFVDAGNKLRNGGVIEWGKADDAEEEARNRAETHNLRVSSHLDKIINVVCAKIG